jgi:hypothetical protein
MHYMHIFFSKKKRTTNRLCIKKKKQGKTRGLDLFLFRLGGGPDLLFFHNLKKALNMLIHLPFNFVIALK